MDITLKTFLKKPLKMIFIIFIMVTLILNSGYALSTVDSSIGLVPLIALFIILFFKYTFDTINEKKVKVHDFYFFGFLIFLFVVTAFNINTTNLFFLIRISMILFVSFTLTKIVTFKEFTKYYVLAMLAITFVSFFFFFSKDFLDLEESFNVVKNINDVYYKNGIIYFEMFTSWNRNCAIFWEPGIFSSYLIIGMLMEIFVKDKSSNFNILVFTIGVITTGSSAGMLLLAITMVLLISKNMKNKYKYIFMFLICVVILIMVFISDFLLSVLLEFNYNVFSKLISVNVSGSTRLGSPLVNLLTFLEKPLFGAGYYESSLIYKNALNANVVAQTSTTTQLMSIFGFVGLFIHMIPLCAIFQSKRMITIEKILIVIIILIILNKEPHLTFLNTYVLLFYLVGTIKLKRIKGNALYVE